MNPKAIYPDKARFNFTGTTNVQSGMEVLSLDNIHWLETLGGD